MPQPRKTDEKPTAEDVADAKVEAAPKDSDEPTFSVERLLRDGEAITGYRLTEVAGAFHDAPPTREVTAADAKARIKEWLKSPVAEPEPAETA